MPSGKGTYGSKRGRPADKGKPRSQHAKKSAKTAKKTKRVLALTKARKIANSGRTKPPVGTELGGPPGITAYRSLRKKAAKPGYQAAKASAVKKKAAVKKKTGKKKGIRL